VTGDPTRMSGKLALLLLLLLGLQNLSAYSIHQDDSHDQLQTETADIWSERGGEGVNATCGYVKIGENVTFFFRVSSPIYARIVIVRPDGSEVEVMRSSQVFPGVVYRFYQVFIDPGVRVIKLMGGVSGRVLDYCTLHVVTSFAGGDVWTDAGGRGYGVEGGTFALSKPVGIWLRTNVTSEVRLVLRDQRGRESVLFSGTLEGERSRRIVVELGDVGNYTLKLMQGNRLLDYCTFSVIKPVERFPPSMRILSINLSDGIISVYGEAVPGTEGEELRLIWDWGDGSIEEGPFPRSHRYEKSGIYTIRVIARQSDGLSANFTYTVFIPPREESITPQPTRSEAAPAENRTQSERVTQEGRKMGSEVLAFVLGVSLSALAFLIASRFMRRS